MHLCVVFGLVVFETAIVRERATSYSHIESANCLFNTQLRVAARINPSIKLWRHLEKQPTEVATESRNAIALANQVPGARPLA